MALNEQEEAKVRELLTAFENGKRINELEPTDGLTGSTLIEVMDESGETRKMELETAVAEAGNPIAGRWWDSTLATTKAGGWFGSLEALRKLPETLGLGRYLVTDDLQMRKLDPLDSRRFEDGSPAALDGSMGQCMWCWSRPWYFTRWSDGTRDKWAITLKPISGKKSYRIPVGGTSWLGVGVMDRTTQTLCSVISDDERYRGGKNDIVPSTCPAHPATDTAQMTMLGMPATSVSATNFGLYARKRGEGWEANWFIAEAAVKILLAVIMGTRNSQAEFSPELDIDGLMQGGFGNGVTTMGFDGSPTWASYNNAWPLVPVEIGVEMGDRTGLVNYALPKSLNASEEVAATTFQVPCFFGLMHAGYGHLYRWVRGVTINLRENDTAEVFVADSMYAEFEPNTTTGLIKVAEMPMVEGYIKRISTEGLCMIPTEVGGGSISYFSDYLSREHISHYGFRTCSYGGLANNTSRAGVFALSTNYKDSQILTNFTAPLCFFVNDPIIVE